MSSRLVYAGIAFGSALALVPALARDVTAGAITVVQPWTRATPGGARIAAGYLVIRNAGDAPDRLLAVTAAAAAKTLPHSMGMKNGVMEMRPITTGIAIPAHGEAVLRPGADHLMFEGLKHPLKAGETVPATLTFAGAGAVAVEFSVEAVGAQGPGSTGQDTMPKDMKMD